MFSGGRERVHWERMDYQENVDLTFFSETLQSLENAFISNGNFWDIPNWKEKIKTKFFFLTAEILHKTLRGHVWHLITIKLFFNSHVIPAGKNLSSKIMKSAYKKYVQI